jgi:ABC-2 type transport system permease protein
VSGLLAFWAIAKRELQLLWHGPTGPVLLAAWIFFTGALFLLELTSFEDAQQRALVLDDPAILALLDFNALLLASLGSHVLVLLLFVVPLLAMRLFAGESSASAWLLSAPVGPVTLVLGKLSGAGAVLQAMLLWLLVFPALLSLLGQGGHDGVVDWRHVLWMWVGLVWVAALYLAVCGALGVWLDSALGAALLGFLVLLGLWLLAGAAPLVPGTLGAVLAFASPASHVEGFLRGTFIAADVAFFAVVTAAALCACVLGVSARRWAR